MSARCVLCGAPAALILAIGPGDTLCGQCHDDAEARKPRPPVAVDPAGPGSAAARAVAALAAIPKGDVENAHREGDGILTTFLHEAGFAAVADAYYAARERTGRGGDWWYA